MRHGLWLGVELLPSGYLLENVREHVTRSAVLRPEHLAHAEQVARLLDEVLEVVIIALVGEVRETHLFGRELIVEVEQVEGRRRGLAQRGREDGGLKRR